VRCFNHPAVEAVGNCKSCHRGLCRECVSDLGHGLACRGVHESEVELLNAIVSRSARIYSVMPKSSYLGPMFLAFMGLTFIGYSYVEGNKAFGLLFFMGAGFVVFSVAIFFFTRRAYGRLK